MPTTLQFAIVVACILLAFYVIRLVLTGKLQLRYSLLWLALSAVLLFFGLFPQPLFSVASFFGFVTSSNFIFVVGFLFVILILLSLSTIVSTQAEAIQNLPQKIALLEKEIHRD